MYLLGIDFETTGIDPKKDRVIEIGVMLWDVEAKAPLEIINRLINPLDDLPISVPLPVAGLTEHNIKELGSDLLWVLDKEILPLWQKADYAVAHNAEFEKSFLPESYRDLKPWIDTQYDVDYPVWVKERSLAALTGNHGIINRYSHRAIHDVLAMMEILSKYSIEEVIEISKSPTVEVLAETAGWEDKVTINKVKKANFRWNPEQKIWTRKGKLIFLEREFPDWDFKANYYVV